MKHGKSGMSIAEVCLAALIIGLLYAALANSVSGVSTHHGRLLHRVAAMAWISSLANNLSQPEVLKLMALREADSSELKKCLELGCPVDTEGRFALSAEEAMPAVLQVQPKFKILTPNLIELKMSFQSRDTFLNARTIHILISRRSFLAVPQNIAVSSCSIGVGFRPEHIVGFDARGGRFLCRTHYLSDGNAPLAPIRLPASGLGRDWDR